MARSMHHTLAGGTVLWLRRDLRLRDQPAWRAALEEGGPVWPVFILDSLIEETYGAAPKWRLGESLRSLASSLRKHKSQLLLRRGDPLKILKSLIAETGARRVVWSRLYDPMSIDRDNEIKSELDDQGIEVLEVNSSLLFEPWTVQTQRGRFYRVFTPFWKAVQHRDIGQPLGSPSDLSPPDNWPASDKLSDWCLGAGMDRGAAIVSRYAKVGEHAASERLDRFIVDTIGCYKSERDYLGLDSTSRLSENLTYGEISPHRLWYAAKNAMEGTGTRTAEVKYFLREIAWREFAYHLLYYTPHIIKENWRSAWDNFPWRNDNEDAEAWRRGMTGIEIVDAAMREMYTTGTMHNRGRMLVASFLTKHLVTGWWVGEAWFRECLIDWDIASNAMGWQWVAGSGPDAAPYFRIFNPGLQAEKFDADKRYRDRFLAEGRRPPHPNALDYFEAVPKSWDLTPDQEYPRPIIDLSTGRQRALEAYNEYRNR